jgi:endoglucanase
MRLNEEGIMKSRRQLFVLTTWLLLALVIAGVALRKAPPSAQAISTPWLSVSGRNIKDPSGNNVILRGVSLVDVGVANTRTRNARALIDMATDNANGWYARVVRLPVYPDPIDGTPGWNANPDAYFNNNLNPAIQECIARQIYCIIDWHYIKDYNSSAVDTSTRNFWNYVAPRYANTPNVIYELYNEPINPDNWSTWKTWAQPWVNIIRSHAPSNLILVGGPRWSQNVAEAASNPFSGGNIAYVAHIYPQHGGQSTWDAWFGNSSATVPYFITEWGWQQGGGAPTSGTTSGYGTPFSSYLDSKGVSWTAWVFDDYWQPVMFDTSWNLLGGESYMGQFTKDFLFRTRNSNLPGGGTGPTATTGSTNPTATRTRTATTGGTVPTATRTRTATTGGTVPTATRTRTATTGGTGGACSPATAISAPFTKDGSGTFCWQISTIPSYINSWNLNSLTVNGVSFTNLYATPSQLPAKINGFWYIAYNSSVAWGHFEAR